ncbi:MAG TPA: energy transducer TonB [Solimonas sp.]|nr:energy transducer TonB [Solimonas sp.]
MILRSTLAAACLLLPSLACALTFAEEDLLTTQTSSPQLSPALVRTLKLEAPAWHKPGTPPRKIKIGEEGRRRSAEAALEALNGLAPEAIQSDFDRAWVVLEKGHALAELRQRPEAKAAFEALLAMPHTLLQRLEALGALSKLGETQYPGWCPPGGLLPDKTMAAPEYPKLAGTRAIEGWVDVMLDIGADGAIRQVAVTSSSLRIFEQPALDWLSRQHYSPLDAMHAGQACFAVAPVRFTFTPPSRKTVPINLIRPEPAFTFRSIGAAIRVREAALATESPRD